MTGSSHQDTLDQPEKKNVLKSLSVSLISVLSEVPVVGPIFKIIAKLPTNWGVNIVLFFLIFVIYPLVSISIIFVFINLSPKWIKRPIQNFALSSLGGEPSLKSNIIESIDETNKFIDNSVAMNFNKIDFADQVQDVGFGQNIEVFYSLKFGGAKKDSKCASVDSPRKLGIVTISVDGFLPVPETIPVLIKYSDGEIERSAKGPLIYLDRNFWERIKKKNSNSNYVPSTVTIRFSFVESSEFKNSVISDCLDYNFRLGLNIYKPFINQNLRGSIL